MHRQVLIRDIIIHPDPIVLPFLQRQQRSGGGPIDDRRESRGAVGVDDGVVYSQDEVGLPGEGG